MRRTLLPALACLFLFGAVAQRLLEQRHMVAAVVDRPIPQNLAKQEQQHRDLLAWNRRTLEGAYDKAGKKDPRWDKPAREALEAAASYLSHETDPPTPPETVFAAAEQALDAGCDDPLIVYLHAYTSRDDNDPGPAEVDRRATAAALAMQQSAYPPLRRIAALRYAGVTKSERKDLTPDARDDAIRLLLAACELLPQSIEQDEHNARSEEQWTRTPWTAINVYKELFGNLQGGFDRVDAVLAKTPSLKWLRLQVKGTFLIFDGWAARGTGYASSVTADGWRKLELGLAGARTALEESWRLKPGIARTAMMMIVVEKGSSGDWAEMEKWYVRAMEANGNDRDACAEKMDWLDPKWHGSREAMLAFGRACRDTRNWRAGITLLVADAHYRAVCQLSNDEKKAYFSSAPVWTDVQGAYDEYLAHFPGDHEARSAYAVYCYLAGKYPESLEQFRTVTKNLQGTPRFPEPFVKQVRRYVASQMRRQQWEKARSAALAKKS